MASIPRRLAALPFCLLLVLPPVLAGGTATLADRAGDQVPLIPLGVPSRGYCEDPAADVLLLRVETDATDVRLSVDVADPTAPYSCEGVVIDGERWQRATWWLIRRDRNTIGPTDLAAVSVTVNVGPSGSGTLCVAAFWQDRTAGSTCSPWSGGPRTAQAPLAGTVSSPTGGVRTYDLHGLPLRTYAWVEAKVIVAPHVEFGSWDETGDLPFTA